MFTCDYKNCDQPASRVITINKTQYNCCGWHSGIKKRAFFDEPVEVMKIEKPKKASKKNGNTKSQA